MSIGDILGKNNKPWELSGDTTNESSATVDGREGRVGGGIIFLILVWREVHKMFLSMNATKMPMI